MSEFRDIDVLAVLSRSRGTQLRVAFLPAGYSIRHLREKMTMMQAFLDDLSRDA
jgi:hypothetical protein